MDSDRDTVRQGQERTQTDSDRDRDTGGQKQGQGHRWTEQGHKRTWTGIRIWTKTTLTEKLQKNKSTESINLKNSTKSNFKCF